MFPLIQQLVQTCTDVRFVVNAALSGEYIADNVCYVELRSTPKATTSMSRIEYMQAIIDACQAASGNIVCRYLPSFDRRQSAEEAQQTMSDIAEVMSMCSFPGYTFYYNKSAANPGAIVGVDVSGQPEYSAVKFLPTLVRANELALKRAIHLAECPQELDELPLLLPHTDRIGHGTFLCNNAKTTEQVRQRSIPIGE